MNYEKALEELGKYAENHLGSSTHRKDYKEEIKVTNVKICEQHKIDEKAVLTHVFTSENFDKKYIDTVKSSDNLDILISFDVINKKEMLLSDFIKEYPYMKVQ